MLFRSRNDCLIMPATTAKQKKFMDAAAHNPAFAKKAGIPVKVAKEFSQASKGQKFSQGGHMATKKMFGGKESMKEEMAEAKAIKSGKITPKQYAKGEKSESAMKKGGKVQKYGLGGMLGNVARSIKTGVVPAVQKIASSAAAQPAAQSQSSNLYSGLKSGVNQIAPKLNSAVQEARPKLQQALGRFGIHFSEGGKASKMGAVKTAKPTRGSASSRADGIAQRGKTKGKMLCGGGMTKKR